MFGGVTISADFWAKVLNLIKEALNSRDIIKGRRKKVNESAPKIAELEKQLKAKEAEKVSMFDVMEYSLAKVRAPHRIAATIADIKRNPPENEQQGTDRVDTKKKGLAI